jgi:hypothetical protein
MCGEGTHFAGSYDAGPIHVLCLKFVCAFGYCIFQVNKSLKT